jgi:hypothetical protein
MNRLPGLMVVAAIVLAPAAHAAASAADRDKAQVIALEKAWVEAEERRDAAALDNILDDQFTATFLVSRPIGKADFIQAQVKPGPKETQELSDRSVILDRDTAVVIDTDTLTTEGKSHTDTARVTAIYIKRGGRWRALAEHMAWK